MHPKIMRDFFVNRLSPFRSQNYRRFFMAQSMSLIGSMAHELARAWLIIQIMGDAQSLGLNLLLTALPGLYFIPKGGMLVDRRDVQKIMTQTKSVLGVMSLILAVLAFKGYIEFWHLVLYGLIEACVIGFDSPCFHVLNVRMVPKEELQQAIALNSINFHAARMLGPVLAGVIMAVANPATVFLLDGLTFLILAYIVKNLKLTPRELDAAQANKSTWHSLSEAFQHFKENLRIRYSLLQLMLTWLFISPLLVVVFRSYFAQKFELNGEQFGYLFMYPAAGSFFGAMAFMLLKPKDPLGMLKYGVPVAFVGTLITGLAPTVLTAGLAMASVGFATYLCFASLTVSVQLEVKDAYRGRLSAVVNLGFISISALLAYPIGLIADQVGHKITMDVLALIFLLGSAALAFCFRGENMKTQNQAV